MDARLEAVATAILARIPAKGPLGRPLLDAFILQAGALRQPSPSIQAALTKVMADTYVRTFLLIHCDDGHTYDDINDDCHRYPANKYDGSCRRRRPQCRRRLSGCSAW